MKTKGKSKRAKISVPLLACLIFSFVSETRAQIASGGSYILEKSVTANGGASGAGYAVEGAIGQTSVGAANQNAPYTIYPGFWPPAPLAPTAAGVTLGGRALTADGQGIRNVRIALTLPGGETRYTTSGSFGYYRFEGVPVGEIYILTAYSKRFTFENPTQIVNLLEARADVDFVTTD